MIFLENERGTKTLRPLLTNDRRRRNIPHIDALVSSGHRGMDKAKHAYVRRDSCGLSIAHVLAGYKEFSSEAICFVPLLYGDIGVQLISPETSRMILSDMVAWPKPEIAVTLK